MDASDDELLLITRWKNGDENAFKSLVERYERRVISVAYRFLMNPVEAEDVAQEAFLKLHESRNRYQPQGKLSSFLFTIVNHLCLNAIRHRRRHPTVPLSDDREKDSGQAPRQWRDPKALSAVQLLETSERQGILLEAIESLAPDEHMAVILDHWEDQSLEAIALVLHKSVPAVKSILFRARAKLRSKLENYFSA